VKCPSCGSDLDNRLICVRCDKQFRRPPAKIEVEYKDFKVSELLEIRSRDQGPRAEEPCIGKTGEQDAGSRKASFLIALILFLLALIACGILLWNLFTR
jgi:hypothetical protein